MENVAERFSPAGAQSGFVTRATLPFPSPPLPPMIPPSPGAPEQKGAAIDAQRVRMALLDERRQMPAVPAAQVRDRLARRHLREGERRRYVLPSEPRGSEAPGRFQEDAVGYIHCSAQRSRPPMTRPSPRPL